MIKKPEIHKKAWGREIWWTNHEEYCSKTLELNNGYYCSLHKHSLKLEDFICKSGLICLALEVGDTIKFYDLEPNDVIQIPRNKYHSFYGVGETNEILEVSTQHFESDSDRLFKSGHFWSIDDWENLIIKAWNEK